MKVVKGMVLDEHLEWVPISYQISREEEFRRHLEDGHVLASDSWVTIAEAVKIREVAAREHAKALNEISLTEGYAQRDSVPPPPETSLFLDEQTLTETAQLQIPPEMLEQNTAGPDEEFRLPESKDTGKMLAFLLATAFGLISVGAVVAYFLLIHHP